MAGRKRSGKRRSALLRDFLRLGDRIQMWAAIENMGPDAGAAWLEILTELAPHRPVEGGLRDPEVAAFDALVGGLAGQGRMDLIPLLMDYCRNGPLSSSVVQALAALGPPEALPVCREALGRNEDSMNTAVARGVRVCAEADRGDPSFLRESFDLLKRHIVIGDRSPAVELCLALLALDHSRATEVLFDPAVLCARRRDLGEILRALSRAGVTIPRERLVTLLADVVSNASTSADASVLAEVMGALQRSDPIGAEPIVDAALESPEQGIRHAAVDAKLEICGLHGWCDEFSNEQRARWPREIEVVETLRHLHLDVESNGLSSVFSNHHPLWWREVVPFLHEIGAAVWATTLTELAKNRGLDDPELSEKDVESMRWPTEMLEREDRIEKARGKELEDMVVLLCRYMLARPDAFRKRVSRIDSFG